MNSVFFQVIDGVDKGRAFKNMVVPVTIGREEGNTVRLTDERVSRFHAKVMLDQGEIVLTDLDSTNGTRVNGETVQLRLLRPGDRVCVGRSTLLFGTMEEIAVDATMGEKKNERTMMEPSDSPESQVLRQQLAEGEPAVEAQADVLRRKLPRLPQRLSPAQAAQISEAIDFLHRALSDALEPVHIPSKAREAVIPLASWHRIQAVQAFLAEYSRSISSPDIDH